MMPRPTTIVMNENAASVLPKVFLGWAISGTRLTERDAAKLWPDELLRGAVAVVRAALVDEKLVVP